MNQAITIQIHLPDGDPTGIKIASLTTQLPQVIHVPRKQVSAAGARSDFVKSGIYFLVGNNQNDARPHVYIGQAENCFRRIQFHQDNKDFWQTALAVTSTGTEFGNTAIRFLEWYAWKQATDSAKFQIVNDKIISEPKTTEAELAALLTHFDTIKLLLATLGYDFFSKIDTHSSGEILYCRSKQANARGIYTNDGFVVLQGSVCNLTPVKSAADDVTKRRQLLLEQGILDLQNNTFVFKQNHSFSSPSAAAVVVLGRSANGWIEWKDQDGKTLKERLQ